MKIIYQKRGTGKSTALVKLSAEHGVPIGCASRCAAEHLQTIADGLGVTIPAPFVVSDLNALRDKKEFYLDDAECIIRSLLGNVTALTMSEDDT